MSQSTQHKPVALITGASTGIGAVYADRLAKRGYDLILVARNAKRMENVAQPLREVGTQVEIIAADLTEHNDLLRVEDFIRRHPEITLLVNNAGSTTPGGFGSTDVESIDHLIRLNVTSVARLSRVALDGLLKHKDGAIINIASVMAFAPELNKAVYTASKSFVLTFSQTLQSELEQQGLYVQAVLPAATRTEIWDHAGQNIDELQGVMEVADLVDAALVGFDRKEKVTIPPLQDEKLWADHEATRIGLLTNFAHSTPGARYTR
ncbi:SDR family NAD(P)-dependent oxidoreductase [Ewingella americana]|uniref:SDR family NAD(P)-dependent oxidoreductase n=1 Tax=Ewingella americana TaxID=41202 RepID=UPI0012AE8215|nr:SDR family oxidoreductase [Ewingella americana]MRT05402.1 SDR family NAD(P)-dependent oxidoreductase [Ewingella americana]